MVSLRFPFWFSQPPWRPPKSNVSPSISAAAMATSVAAAVTVGVGMGFAISYKATNQRDPFLQKAWDFFFSPHPVLPSPIWGSLSLASTSTVDPKTGVSFPPVLNDSQRLLGIGLRKNRFLGLKNIDVYAFGNIFSLQSLTTLLKKSVHLVGVLEFFFFLIYKARFSCVSWVRTVTCCFLYYSHVANMPS